MVLLSHNRYLCILDFHIPIYVLLLKEKEKQVQQIKALTSPKMEQLVALRNNKVHVSSVMLVHIIRKLTSQTGSAYFGEIEAYYRELTIKYPHKIEYTSGGMRAHLRVLKERGFVKISKDGIYNKYRVTLKGDLSVRGLF